MTKDYLLLEWSNRLKFSTSVKEILNFDNEHWLDKGRKLKSVWPSDVKLTMNPDHPRDTILTDNLFNTYDMLVVSERLKTFLENRKVTGLEYLPVTILDLKRKPKKEPYFIVNDYDRVDCLDAKASGAKYSRIIPTQVDESKRIVLDPKRINPARELFRIKDYNEPILVSRELAAAMDQEKFTAIQWVELADYDGDA